MKHGITQLFSDSHPQKSVIKNSEPVYTNGDRALLEKYEMVASKRRVPSRITEPDFKASLEMVTDVLNNNGAEKIIGKLHHQTIIPNGKNSKSPKLGPIASKPLSLYEVVDEKKDHLNAPTTNFDLKD